MVRLAIDDVGGGDYRGSFRIPYPAGRPRSSRSRRPTLNPEARRRYLKLIRGESTGPAAGLGRAVLSAAGFGYAAAMRARNRAFDAGWKATHRASVPVISVGNLTLGGTGKTPMVEWLARRARRDGTRVAILSRGYGAAEGVNDEGRVLEENLPDVPHLQGPDRVELARIAVEELESQLLLLDDGFQHRRLARDLDVVMLDALDPFGLGRVFPRGLLREPIAGLKRAGLVVLSRADLVDADRRTAIRAEAERRAGPIAWVEARHQPIDLIDGDGQSEPIGDLSGRKVLAFCGLGNPDGFRKTLDRLGIKRLGFQTFPDHHAYTRDDVDGLIADVRSLGADLVLTTQKDLVKVRIASIGPAPLRALRIGLAIQEGAQIMEDALAPILGACRQ